MDTVLVLDIIAWILTGVGYVMNYLNEQNYVEKRNIVAIIAFGLAFVLFMIALGMFIAL